MIRDFLREEPPMGLPEPANQREAAFPPADMLGRVCGFGLDGGEYER